MRNGSKNTINLVATYIPLNTHCTWWRGNAENLYILNVRSYQLIANKKINSISLLIILNSSVLYLSFGSIGYFTLRPISLVCECAQPNARNQDVRRQRRYEYIILISGQWWCANIKWIMITKWKTPWKHWTRGIIGKMWFHWIYYYLIGKSDGWKRVSNVKKNDPEKEESKIIKLNFLIILTTPLIWKSQNSDQFS